MNRNDESNDTGNTLTTPPFLANIEHDTGSVYGTDDEDMFSLASSDESSLSSVEDDWEAKIRAEQLMYRGSLPRQNLTPG